MTFKQKTAAEHLDMLNNFSLVTGMTQNYSGMSDGPRIANVEIKGRCRRPHQRYAKSPQAVRVPSGEHD